MSMVYPCLETLMIHTALPNLPRDIESRIRHQTSPPLREKPHHHPENDNQPFKRPDNPKGTRSDILKEPPPPGLTTQTTPHQPKTVRPRPLQTLQHSSGPWRHDSRVSAPTTTFDQENSRRQLDNDTLVAPTPRQKSPPAPNPVPTPEYVRQTGTTSLEPPEKRAVPLPTATPTFATNLQAAPEHE
ncbi:hypothetical protein E4T56_gene8259 [Termitomyces sp. T112]|nr:hypothetical protein E4T56_gene8259 [Termitomyces sp. T112]